MKKEKKQEQNKETIDAHCVNCRYCFYYQPKNLILCKVHNSRTSPMEWCSSWEGIKNEKI